MSESSPEQAGDRQDPAEPKQVDESVDTSDQPEATSPASVEVAPAQPEVNVNVEQPSANPEPSAG